MKYQGSKRRIAKEILPIILHGRKDEPYVEPFVGGANVIDKVTGVRIGYDNNFYLISLLKAIRDGWEPPEYISEEEYEFAKDSNIPHYKGFIGFCCSFGGKFFGGYARSGTRNFASEGRRNLLKQAKNLQGVEFKCLSFEDISVPKNSIIYCDPPYKNTTNYKTGNFDYVKFYKWCENKASENHRIFISEYSMPDNFQCIWEKEISTSLSRVNRDIKRVERLFVPR